jgi:hypothetical protein
MSQTPEEIYRKLNRFFAYSTKEMVDQAARLGSSLTILSNELENNLETAQKERFEESIKRTRFLLNEIIGYGGVYKTILNLIVNPMQMELEKFEVCGAIDHAIEHAQRFVGDFSGWVTTNKDEKEIAISSLYSLWVSVISSQLVYTYLMAPSSHIFIEVAQTEADVILKVSGYQLPFKEVKYVDEQAGSLSLEVATLCISVLGGSQNWQVNGNIPNELVVRLPKQSSLSSSWAAA